MAVRSTMLSLIARVRLLINDPNPNPGVTVTVFQDQDIQDVMDESRVDVFNQPLTPQPTYTGSTMQYLDYFSTLGGWEDGAVLKQYLTLAVTPSAIEPIAGHWTFSTSTLPPVAITGKLYDVYRSAADLLERQAAKWTLTYDFSSDGASFKRSQAVPSLLTLARTYRTKQRAMTISMVRNDLTPGTVQSDMSLGARSIDLYASGDGR